MAPGVDGAGAITSTGAAAKLLDNLEGNKGAVSGFGVALPDMICMTVFAASCPPGEVRRGSAISVSCVPI